MNLMNWLGILTLVLVFYIYIRLFLQQCRPGGFFREKLLKLRFDKEQGKEMKDFLAYYLWGIFCISNEVEKESSFYKGFFAFEFFLVVYIFAILSLSFITTVFVVIVFHFGFRFLGFCIHCAFEKLIDKEREKIWVQDIEANSRSYRCRSEISELASRAVFNKLFHNNLISFISGFLINLIACVAIFFARYTFIF